MKRFYLRFDVGKEIGFGHWYRCLELARTLRDRGAEVVLLSYQLPASVEVDLEKFKFPLIRLQAPQDDAEHLAAMSLERGQASLILDLMGVEEGFVSSLRDQVRVASIGGSGPGLDFVQLRIEGALKRENLASRFRGNKLCVGLEYVILRQEFRETAILELKPAVKHLLISLGGDAEAVGLKIAKLVNSEFLETRLSVVLDRLAQVEDAPEGVELIQALSKPAELMSRVDVALCGGGMTAYELSSLGTPFVILPQTALQEEVAKSFAERGAADFVSCHDQLEVGRLSRRIVESLKSLEPLEVRKERRQRLMSLVDHGGRDRVCELLMDRQKEWS